MHIPNHQYTLFTPDPSHKNGFDCFGFTTTSTTSTTFSSSPATTSLFPLILLFCFFLFRPHPSLSVLDIPINLLV